MCVIITSQKWSHSFFIESKVRREINFYFRLTTNFYMNYTFRLIATNNWLLMISLNNFIFCALQAYLPKRLPLLL